MLFQSAFEHAAIGIALVAPDGTRLVKVCAWTKRIQINDRWISMDEFLRNYLHLNLTHGMSVEDVRMFNKE